MIGGEQGWRSGESNPSHQCGPCLIPRVDAIMWVAFVVCSCPYLEGFFYGYSGFLPSTKSNVFKFQFDQKNMGTFERTITFILCTISWDPLPLSFVLSGPDVLKG